MKTVAPLALMSFLVALNLGCRTHSGSADHSETLATSATPVAENKENQPADRIITDYPLTVSSIKVVASDRETLGSKQPIKLVIQGSVRKNNKIEKVSGEVDGISIPYGNNLDTRLYLLLVREGSTIYTEQKDEPVARINARNELEADLSWKWTLTYREYRYTFHDHVTALMFGTRVQNQEAIFAEADPRAKDSQEVSKK